MNLDVIRSLSEKRPGGMRKLASDIGMSEANLHRCIRNNKIQSSDLEKIAMLLNVDIRIFFDEELTALSKSIVKTHGDFSPATMNGDVSVGSSDMILSERVKHLEALVAEKERTIGILMGRQ